MEPRIGVFICHCGSNIANTVDVEEVVRYASTLPNVIHADHNMYSCSEDGIGSIKTNIKEKGIDRVVVAACTPRTHEPLFRNAYEAAGINRYLFEFVNIREHCSWIHMKERELATEKAKRLVRMGVAKVALLTPQEESESPVVKSAAVIGGGVSGMTAAISLADQGFETHLIEKGRELGGLVKDLGALFPSESTPLEFVRAMRDEAAASGVSIHLSSEIKDIQGYIGNFDVTISENGKEEKFKVGVVITATGAEELKPVGEYGYGRYPNVITQSELEKKLAKGERVGNTVMIQCVGARQPGREYCSRICCMTAIKNAGRILALEPKSRVSVVHRDIMSYNARNEALYRKSMEDGVTYLRYTLEDKPRVEGKEMAEKITLMEETLGEDITLPFDTLVLSTPLVPNPDNGKLQKMLKVPLDRDGFFLEAHVKLRPVEFATDGVFICGCARWPSDVPECISQAGAAAAKASIPLRAGKVRTEAITAEVDETTCTGCGNCVATCAYGAISIVEVEGRKVARVNLAQCKGCGACVGSCHNGSIQQRGFTEKQLISMIDCLTEGD
jgi:heterodisulfide reductase subunit A